MSDGNGSFGNQQTHTAIGGQSQLGLQPRVDAARQRRVQGARRRWGHGLRQSRPRRQVAVVVGQRTSRLAWEGHVQRRRVARNVLGLGPGGLQRVTHASLRRFGPRPHDDRPQPHGGGPRIQAHRGPGLDDELQTRFARNWYKLDRAVDSLGQKVSLGSVLEGDHDDVLGWLRGKTPPTGRAWM